MKNEFYTYALTLRQNEKDPADYLIGVFGEFREPCICPVLEVAHPRAKRKCSFFTLFYRQ